MKKSLYILLFLMNIGWKVDALPAMGNAVFTINIEKKGLSADTSVKEDQLMANVIQNTSQPAAETVAILHDFTKFGFRNLFNDFQYNPTLPYDQQVNPKAELYMRSYLQKHENELMGLKKKSGLYFDLIDNVFRQYGLPTELKYLAVIESSLKTGATSVVGAAGPWQFMPQTAKNMGLRVNSSIDERRDFYKSTHAAARYLLLLYQTYHDWLLVIAAYNGGNGRVNEAIQRAHSNNFWQLQHQLPEESRNHVKKFIATHYVMENKTSPFAISDTKENTPELTQEDLNNTTVTSISGRYISTVIIQQLQLDSKEFNRLNPAFDDRLEQEGHYALRLKQEHALLFNNKKYEILNLCIQQLLSTDNSSKVKSH